MNLIRKYKCTKGNSTLTKTQRDFYEDNGYMVIRNLVDSEFLNGMKQRFLDICNNKVDSPLMTVAKDPSLKNKGLSGEYVINKIQDFTYDDVLFKFCCYSRMLQVIEDIIGPNIIATNTMLINKPPDASFETSVHPLHQDLLYFPFRPAEKNVGVWTAMERVDKSNGCLYVVPGSHGGDLLKHGTNTHHKLYHGVECSKAESKVWLPMNKGDTIFFHPLLLHGSGPNLTQGFRKAISCHYASSDCHFIDVKGTVQEDVAKEIVELGKRKSGVNLSFQDIWKLKSRVVKGDPGNFTPSMSSHL